MSSTTTEDITQDEFDQRMKAVEERLGALETNFAVAKAKCLNSEADGVLKVKQSLFHHRVFNYRLVTVPKDYYDRTFQERADILSASIPQLCKSLIFENVNFDATCSSGDDDVTYSKYYLVLLQYEAKFDTIKFENLIWGLRPVLSRLTKSKFNFKLASEENNSRLSGFKHNAVTPFGMTVERIGAVPDESGYVVMHIPIVMCSRLLSLKPSYIYLGGGEVDVKLGLGLDEFVRVHKPVVGSVSEGR